MSIIWLLAVKCSFYIKKKSGVDIIVIIGIVIIGIRVCYCGAEQAILKFSNTEYWHSFQRPSKAPFSWTTCARRRNCPSLKTASRGMHFLILWVVFQLGIFCDVWLNQHITPHNCCVQWCIWDKSSSTSSLYHSLHLILCFSICHVRASQKVASAHSGWCSLREPRGLHSHASCVTKQGLRSHCTAWASGWGPTHGAAPSSELEESIKETKGTGWDFHILSGHGMGGRFSQQEQPQEQEKQQKGSTNQRRVFNLTVTFQAGRLWDQPGWSPSLRNAPTHTHSALWPRVPELPLSHKASFKTALLSRWDALGMGCTDNSP